MAPQLEPPELLLAVAVAFLAGPYLLDALPLQGALPVLGALLAAALAAALLLGPRLRYGREGKPSANDGVPALVRSHVVVPEGGKEFSLGILVKRSDDPHPTSVVIYHVGRTGYAARHHAELKVGECDGGAIPTAKQSSRASFVHRRGVTIASVPFSVAERPERS